MKSCTVWIAILLLAIASVGLAQDRTIPLKNWAAPLYWQAPATESESAAKAAEAEPRSAGAITPPLVFVGVTPCRVADTRNATGTFGGPIMSAGSTRGFPVPASACGIPATAQAYSLNVTVVPTGGLAYLSIWPTGQPQPLVSTLNSWDGQVTANAAIVPAGTSGGINVYVTDATHVILDINGYYLPPGALALAAGSAAAPALTFSNDANSGVYSPSAGNVTVTAGGTNRLTVNSSGIVVNGNADVSGDFYKSGVRILIASGSNAGAGYGSLRNLGGGWNTALGSYALYNLTSGQENSAVGYGALNAATTGNQNTALGSGALWTSQTGHRNTALGYVALTTLGNATDNTAVGYKALTAATTGNYNVAVGSNTLINNLVGTYNTAVGYQAGLVTTGNWNTNIGYYAGYLDTTGGDNIRINNYGVAGETNTARIGGIYISRTFIAGIRGVTTGNANAIPVYIDSAGQLGTASSSRRVKTDIRDMGDTTNTIMALHPVRFHYKMHGAGSPEQYGLVAEEVAEVAPDLTARNTDGQIETVHYDKVNAMLLNEVQKQHRLIESQRQQIDDLMRRLTELESLVKLSSPGQK